MSDTPQTDEQINGKPCTQFGLLAGISLRNALVPSEFARQLERELAAANAEIARLREAANAVVERWETPLWKDVEPTAHVIYALRDELAAQQQASK
jgi:hypothetical protein